MIGIRPASQSVDRLSAAWLFLPAVFEFEYLNGCRYSQMCEETLEVPICLYYNPDFSRVNHSCHSSPAVSDICLNSGETFFKETL